MDKPKVQKQQVIVKRVSPYPFYGELEVAGKKTKLKIRKLTLTGFIALLPDGFVKVGQEYQAALELPVHSRTVATMVKVMKTYDQFRDYEGPNQRVERMAEFRFLKLTEGYKNIIEEFLSAIKQQ